MDPNAPPRILVLGAGYGGLVAAARLAGRAPNAEITLVNQFDTFIERVRLHQYAAGQSVRRRPIADILAGTSVCFLQGTVRAIDPAHKEVHIETGGDGIRLAYDVLVYALGSTTDLESTPGARKHAHALTPAGPNSAEALRAALPALNERGGALVVVGGGPTGIEATAEFAESFPSLRVSLVTRGGLAPTLGGRVQRYIRRRLERLGVTVREDSMVERAERRALIVAGGESIPFDLCLWAGGFSVPAVARDASLAVNERGQVLIDPFMRSVSHPDIYALGDAAWPVEPPSVPVRMAAYTAAVMGAHTADCLANVLNGKKPRPLSFAYAGQGIALGRKDAVGFNTYPDDKPNRPMMTGRLAVGMREFFVNVLGSMPIYERRWPGIFFWLGKGRVKAASATGFVPALPVEEQPS